MKKFLLALLWLGTLGSCTIAPVPIEYGSDSCVYCKMGIVDARHAAEAVSSKGKVYKFDAIECLLLFIKDRPDMQYAFQLVNDYNDPGALISAPDSYFLISRQIPSPMGAYLSAFRNKTAALAMQLDKGGEIYNWPQLQEHLEVKNFAEY